jgi:adenine-specific DNA-methyltransferase
LLPSRQAGAPFCSKVKAAGAMKQLLNQLDYKHIFISYNDEGIIPLEQMQSLCSETGQYSLIKEEYQRFKADAKRKQSQTSTVEYLHCISR